MFQPDVTVLTENHRFEGPKCAGYRDPACGIEALGLVGPSASQGPGGPGSVTVDQDGPENCQNRSKPLLISKMGF